MQIDLFFEMVYVLYLLQRHLLMYINVNNEEVYMRNASVTNNPVAGRCFRSPGRCVQLPADVSNLKSSIRLDISEPADESYLQAS